MKGQILPVCLLPETETCSFRKQRKIPRRKRGRNVKQVTINVCTWKETCNQKRILNVLEAKKYARNV
ncbi:hypothetical protein DRO59_07140 [Candidatus Bathyarchaeota archaeon]|nr:MAG: hypothetical protein DRO59_07140 [Candidatus Bathyarchaeota archaeon]